MRLPIVLFSVILAGLCAAAPGSPFPEEPEENKTIENGDLDTEVKDYEQEERNGDKIQMTRAYMTEARLWPDGKVIYEIDMSIHEPEAIRGIHAAARSLSAATCVKFINRTTADSKQPYLAFHRFTKKMLPRCSSWVGFQNEFPQDIIVTPKYCDKHPENYAGSVTHEMMHALGFLHEFQRIDRNGYVKYLGEKTDDDYERNYRTVLHSEIRRIRFNFNSIMQYNPRFRFEEVKPLPAGYPPPIGTFADMGQECKISKGDIDLINYVYADECKLAKPVQPAKEDFPIEGTNCNFKIEAMNDEMMAA